MQVAEVLATTVVLPLDIETAFSTRLVRNREYTLVRVKGSRGAEGIGFCYGGSRAGCISTLAVRELLKDNVIGRDTDEVEEIWDAMYRDSLLQGRRGSVLRAMSAIDIALWDLMGKEKRVPLYSLLGVQGKETVPAYASGGYYFAGKTLEDLADEVRDYVNSGFPAVKIKVGRLSTEEDLARIEACRKAIGPDVQLFLDANNAWPDAPSAVKAIRRFQEYEPGWIEEPLMPDDIDGHAAIATEVATPVATGEIEATRWGFQQLIHRKAANILQPDATVCGGITEWRKIAALAATSNISISPHWFADLHVHLVAATPNATWVEFFPDTKVLNFMRLLTRSLEVRHGELVLPKDPGLGIELDKKVVERYSIDGWH